MRSFIAFFVALALLVVGAYGSIIVVGQVLDAEVMTVGCFPGRVTSLDERTVTIFTSSRKAGHAVHETFVRGGIALEVGQAYFFSTNSAGRLLRAVPCETPDPEAQAYQLPQPKR